MTSWFCLESATPPTYVLRFGAHHMRLGCAFVLGSSSKTVHSGQVLLSKCYETDCGGGTRGEEGQMRPASVLIADTMPEDSGTSLGDARPSAMRPVTP